MAPDIAKIKSTKLLRSTVKGQLTKMLNIVSTIERSEQDDVDSYRIRLARAKTLFNEFELYDKELLELDPDNATSQTDEVFETFVQIESLLKRLIRKCSPSTFPSGSESTSAEFNNTLFNTTHHAESKLPKLIIPKFNGDPLQWQSFFDLFSRSVHDNQGISPAQKMGHLITLLAPEAEKVIHHLPISDANYHEALTLLKNRFDKKHHLVNSYIKTFLNLPSVRQSNVSELRNILDTTNQIIRGLSTLGNEAEGRDPWLVYLLINKLDSDSQTSWAQTTADKEFPTLMELMSFLEKRSNALESIGTYSSNPGQYQASRSKPIKGHFSTNYNKCSICSSNDHQLYVCKKFQNMSIQQRRQCVKADNRCFNCLTGHHGVFKCYSKNRCAICSRKHHTLIHTDSNETSNSSESSSTKSTLNNNSEASVANNEKTQSHFSEHSPSQNILPTALVNVTDGMGQQSICRALLDSGSVSSFISESCCQRLKLSRKNGRKCVTGVAGAKAGVTNGITSLFITPIHNNEKYIEVEAYVLPSITSNLPDYTSNRDVLNHLSNLQLADPYFNVSSEIDILIGVEHFFEILKTRQIKGPTNQPIAQQTIFGWIIGGKWQNSTTNLQSMHTSNQSQQVASDDNPINIDKTLKRFWEIEECTTTTNQLTEDEQKCEDHFKKYSIMINGRFMLKIPLREDVVHLGSSLPLAISCFKATERRFQKDETYFEHYRKFMQEYEDLGHMQLVSSHEIKQPVYYIPHHGILKMTDNSSKFRVVFNASAKTSSGSSLNDHMLVGPTVQSSLYSIILRFRQHAYAFSCDIEKMYRQFLVYPEDRPLQRIVWREKPTDALKHYELLTVTYGTASAPYLATRALKQLGIDHENSNKSAANILQNDAYVDDIMTGSNSIQEASNLQNDLIKILESAGMKLSKWVSNCPELLDNVNASNHQTKELKLQETVSVLGIKWSPENDTFKFKVNLPTTGRITKRTILSEASQLFDPIGWLSPIIIKIKVLYQSLWLLSVSWDDDLPKTIEDEWKLIKQEFKDVEQVSIPRWYDTRGDDVELHGFGDASELAYGAVVYIRVKSQDQNWKCTLVSSKTKVAPIKKLSIPRLELCAAVLLVKLMNMVSGSLSITVSNQFYWTDSTTVLGWLSSHPGRWPTFIANRTSEILQNTTREQWSHVTSKFNPADVASRGLSPNELINCEIWWHGPPWLEKNSDHWPKQSTYITTEEKKKSQVLVVFENYDVIGNIMQSCSTLYKSKKVLAYCQRFIHNRVHAYKNHLKRKTGLISKEECHNALILILKWSQRSEFKFELDNISNNRCLQKSSKIISLNPFIDESGILRVGGRLANAVIPYETKHQIILANKSIVTLKLVEDYHIRYHHAGYTLLSNLLRNKFWILRCKDVIKQTIKKCIQCFRHQPQVEEQQMGNLPSVRVDFVRPFVKVGVDFCGPILVYHKRSRGQKPIKSWICLFVCLSTKAIHLELVLNLTTESFLAALRRLVSRRGPCSDIHSDCGTNFIGANNALKEVYKFLKLNNENIHYSLLKENISWHFNPPASPHQGGLWESMIKLVKTQLHKTTGDHTLTVEEMQTLLCELENIINSRPLCVLSKDNIEALTPAHFIFHHAASYVPDYNYESEKLSKLSKWQIIQKLVQHFWRRWQNEYLILLQRRSKWNQVHPNVEIDDIVVIKNENTPPTKWKLARVESTRPGEDGLVRVVTLKTESGQLTRPIQKICKLPIGK